MRAIAEARIKTDRIDSHIRAHLLRCDLLPTAYVRPRAERTAQQILRQRMFFVRLRTMVKNRIHVLIDRQLAVREGASEFSDLFGQAGLTWLRTVDLPEVERQLLTSEAKQGNKWLRWAMIEAVRPAIKTDSGLRAYSERLRHRKGPNPAKVATARRRLTIVHRVLSQDRPYRRPVNLAMVDPHTLGRPA